MLQEWTTTVSPSIMRKDESRFRVLYIEMQDSKNIYDRKKTYNISQHVIPHHIWFSINVYILYVTLNLSCLFRKSIHLIYLIQTRSTQPFLRTALLDCITVSAPIKLYGHSYLFIAYQHFWDSLLAGEHKNSLAYYNSHKLQILW